MSVSIVFEQDDKERYNQLLDAIDNRAEEIDEDNDELRTLFELRQSFGPIPPEPPETIDFEFDKVSRNRAKEILTEQDDETLQWLGNQL